LPEEDPTSWSWAPFFIQLGSFISSDGLQIAIGRDKWCDRWA
jgi:hypothetical protein